jgi:hypothetical protein
MGMTRVSNLKAWAVLLVVGLLVTLLVLALSACSGAGGQEEAKGRPLPQDQGPLRPGEYHSVKFKPPLSFKVGKGWTNTANQLSDFFQLGQQGERGTCRVPADNLRERQGSLETRPSYDGRG